MNAKWKLLLLSTVSGAVLSLSGCAPECDDKFDCASKGANYACSAGKCVQTSGTGGGFATLGGGAGTVGGGTATTGGGDGTTGGGDGTTGGGDGTTGGGDGTTGGGDGTTGGGTATTGGGDGTTGGGTATTGGGDGTTGGGTATTGGGTATTGGGTATTGGGTATTGGGTATTGGGTATTGGGTGSTCVTITQDSQFLGQSNGSVAFYDALFTPELGDTTLSDFMSLELYAPTSGSYDLSLTDYNTCDQCVTVTVDEGDVFYGHTSGTLNVTGGDPLNGSITATLTGVTLVELDANYDPVVGGSCIYIPTATIDVTAPVVDAGVPDAGSGSVDAQIAQARADSVAGTTSTVTIQGAVITYVKPLVAASVLSDGGSSDPAGFFIQGTASGPAMFVALDPATLPGGPYVVGDRVDITVSTVGQNVGLHQITGITSIVRQSSGVLLPPTDVSSAAFFDTGVLDGFESKYVTLAGTVTGTSGNSGTGYSAFPIATMGTTDGGTSNFVLRVPTTVRDALEPTQLFGAGCTFIVNGPVWRYTINTTNRAQPSVWNQSEITIVSCPAPTVTSAVSTSNTMVAVNFSRLISAASVTAAAFSIDNGLVVLDAGLSSAQQVLLQTSSQDGGTQYTVTVASSVLDTRGTGVGSPNSAIFTATAAPTGALATNLFISEYGEGGVGNNKYIEIYNGTGASVDLSNYSLRSYTNGSATVASGAITLTGMLANGAAFTVCNTGIDASITSVHPCSMTSGSNPVSFNGDDSIELVQGTTAIDVIGLHTGVDPGTGWPVCGIANATADHILVRKPTQISPTTDWAASSGTSASDCQWFVSSAATLSDIQTNNGIGSHTFTP